MKAVVEILIQNCANVFQNVISYTQIADLDSYIVTLKSFQKSDVGDIYHNERLIWVVSE